MALLLIVLTTVGTAAAVTLSAGVMLFLSSQADKYGKKL